MASKQFVPLSTKLIDEGEFVDELDEAITETMKGLVAFRRRHGDRSHKAKATITAKIEMVVTDVENGAYQINWKLDQSLPKRPAQSSFAVEGGTEDNSDALFVRTSGSDNSHPDQMKFATRDGRTIDPETGEAH
ncbi:hypothetical protein [Novipirellula caenicola]|uniref:Phage protein n=1 Tax=Novipirellula caenicola TaxID=1536901 RepID=A0ABP9W1L7_9BACT